MTTDLQLELLPIEAVPRDVKVTIQGAFEQFHATNPHVYTNLRAIALRAVRSGRKKLGIKALFETLRWEYMLHTTGSYKMNNNFTSRYARMLMANELELKDAFEVRSLHAD